MKIQHFRNATMVIETANQVILVDPMLGPMSTLPTFTFFRFKARRNPIVPLPNICQATLEKVTHCLITHQHPDHIDQAGIRFLREKKIPVSCSVKDAKALKKRGLQVVQAIDYWQSTDFLGGRIEGIPARHGYGFIAQPMGNVMGFYLDWPDEVSIYLSSDTIYTQAVEKVLQSYRPDIAVVACGSAQLDLFRPLLMHMDDILRFVRQAPGKVIANHLEAVNHCPTSREGLRKRLQQEGLLEKVAIPEDGEWVEIV